MHPHPQEQAAQAVHRGVGSRIVLVIGAGATYVGERNAVGPRLVVGARVPEPF